MLIDLKFHHCEPFSFLFKESLTSDVEMAGTILLSFPYKLTGGNLIHDNVDNVVFDITQQCGEFEDCVQCESSW